MFLVYIRLGFSELHRDGQIVTTVLLAPEPSAAQGIGQQALPV
ncbi:MAG TPA: hypothetical protein VKV73_05245 [Chloroflexota bacterium]|nr:hypothetical protein [Chloroflexota bacterium]